MTSPAQVCKAAGSAEPSSSSREIASGVTRRRIAANRPPIVSAGQTEGVAAYWEDHTVPQLAVWTERGSLRQLEKRFAQYPLFREFSGLWGSHDGERLLDYGCGPGNDLTGFALFTGAEKIIGVDVSREALARRGGSACHPQGRPGENRADPRARGQVDPARRRSPSTSSRARASCTTRPTPTRSSPSFTVF